MVIASSASAATTLLLLVELGVRALHILVRIRLAEVDLGGLDVWIERGQGLERGLGASFGEIPVLGIGGAHIVEGEEIQRLVAEQVLLRHGLEDLLRGGIPHPSER